MEIFDNRKIAISAYFVVMFVIPRSGAVAFHATVS